MTVTLDDEARRRLVAFEEATGAGAIDCIEVDERLVIVVERGEMAEAIGPDGRTIQRFEERIGRPVRLVEHAEDPETFVANALTPAAIYNVTISENDDTVAYVEVASEDRGVAIGTEGRTIEAARRLAARHVDVDDVQLT